MIINDTLMKFFVTNNKIIMEIEFKDLLELFHNSPSNMSEMGNKEFCKVKRSKRKEFAEWIVKND